LFLLPLPLFFNCYACIGCFFLFCLDGCFVSLPPPTTIRFLWSVSPRFSKIAFLTWPNPPHKSDHIYFSPAHPPDPFSPLLKKCFRSHPSFYFNLASSLVRSYFYMFPPQSTLTNPFFSNRFVDWNGYPLTIPILFFSGPPQVCRGSSPRQAQPFSVLFTPLQTAPYLILRVSSVSPDVFFSPSA